MIISKNNIFLIGIMNDSRGFSPRVSDSDRIPKGSVQTEYLFSSATNEDLWFKGYAYPETLKLLRKVHPLCQDDLVPITPTHSRRIMVNRKYG